MLKHSGESGNEIVSQYNFKVLAKNFKNNTGKQKIAESLLTKQIRPTLNIRNKLEPKLFN